MRSEIRSLQARVRALQRKLAPELAFVRLRKLADDYAQECQRARSEHRPQPENRSLTRKIVEAGFRLHTFMDIHKYLDRCRKQDTLPERRDILLALIPWAWETINRHIPRNSDFSDLGDEARERFWKEWLTVAGSNLFPAGKN